MADLRDRILDATAVLLEERGLAGVNTNAIAKTAGCSVGSVYVYFRNKQAVLAALLERYGARLLTAVAPSLTDSTDWRGLVNATVEAFATFYREEPGYRELWIGVQLTDDTVSAGQSWGDIATAQFGELMRSLRPELSADDAAQAAEVCIYVVSSLVTRGLATERPGLIEQSKLVLLRYLAPLLDPNDAREMERWNADLRE